jgi:hypothetical protein
VRRRGIEPRAPGLEVLGLVHQATQKWKRDLSVLLRQKALLFQGIVSEMSGIKPNLAGVAYRLRGTILGSAYSLKGGCL